eukprot:TRINITY_DN570_c0_g1_i2.p1 TRINITY_DN570_c0_g1~~TRINITY_DN570_c0_g1_i2.p1  ORF type:complete len:852 (+),score=194.99 TRINITY_DN570_c0_g1_i2:85-2640(+)
MRSDGGASKREVKPTPFRSQLNALLRKNAVLQKRAKKSNVCQCMVPILLMGLLVLFKFLGEKYLSFDVSENIDPTKKFVKGIYTGSHCEEKIPYFNAGPASVGKYISQGDPSNTGLLSYISSEGTRGRGSQPVCQPPQFQEHASKDSVDDYIYSLDEDDKTVMMAYSFLEYDGDKVFRYALYYNASVEERRDGFAKQDIPTTQFMMNRAFFKSVAGNSNGVFQVYMRDLPTPSRKAAFDVVAIFEALYYTWILHMLLPLFVDMIVFEKQHKLRDMMKMMGLRMRIYWTVQSLFDWILYIISISLVIAIGIAFGLRFFVINSFMLWVILFILWGFALIPLSFLFSTLFSKARTAAIIGSLYVLMGSIFAQIIVNHLESNHSADIFYFLAMLEPSIALNLGLQQLSKNAAIGNYGMTFDNANSGDNRLFEVYLMIAVDSVLLSFVAFYLEGVFPSGFGVKKHPFFPCLPETWSKRVREQKEVQSMEAIESETSRLIDHDTTELGADVLNERNHVLQGMSSKTKGIFIKDLRKEFKGHGVKLVAVHRLSLGVPRGECLGLLGHNGAGKTTVISILSGLFSATRGAIRMDGFNPLVDMDIIHSFTSVCPQDDILWNDQTGREHLLFYGRLKGLEGDELQRAVDQRLHDVNLTEAQNKLSKSYSGGMKRRLSTAIALIGHPKVVFFDEPTTGLDPTAKREVWNAIIRSKGNSAVILTTHSMEEADALCDRIAVMSHGKLQCIGHSLELKQRYGSGYKISTSTDDESKTAGIFSFVTENFPGCESLDSIAGTSHFLVPYKSMKNMSEIFRLFEVHQEELGITDWGIQMATLEEVFVRLTTLAAENEKHSSESIENDL